VSAPYTVQVEDSTYKVVDDQLRVYHALIAGRLLNAVSGVPLGSAPKLVLDRPDLTVRFTEGGYWVVRGYVELAFPDLATTAYNIKVSVAAGGYRPATVPVKIPINSTFPVLAGDALLMPDPVRIQGRVVDEPTRSPQPGSAIAVTTANVAVLRTPISAGHAAGIAVHTRTLGPAGPARAIAADVRAGSSEMTLDNAAGLAAGDILQLGAPSMLEFAVVQAVGATVRLRLPLMRSRPAGTPVQAVVAGGAGPNATLAVDAAPGDGILRLSVALGPGAALEIVDGAGSEFRALNAVADANGYYQLDGITGIAALSLSASHAGFSNAPIDWAIDYNQAVNNVDFRLTP